jgi:hypothetical protein
MLGTTSLTRFHAPNPMAIPAIPAPASKGVMSMPILVSAVRTVIVTIMACNVPLIGGRSVARPELIGEWP